MKKIVIAIAALVPLSLYSAVSTYDYTNVGFSDWEVMRYYFYLYLIRFSDYPWVVRVAYILVIMSILCLFVFFMLGVVRYYHTRRETRYFRNIVKNCDEELTDICLNPMLVPVLTISDVLEKVVPRDKKIKKWQSEEWVHYFLSLRAKLEDSLNINNLQQAFTLLNLHGFMDRQIRFGLPSNRLKYVRAVEYLQIDIPESALVRMVNARDPLLRSHARFYYMRKTDYDPFRFLEGGQSQFTRGVAVELHELLRDRVENNRTVPSLVPMIGIQNDPRMAALLVREVGYWGDDEDVKSLITYFDSKNQRVRQAAFECMGQRKCEAAVDDLITAYAEQSEPLRRVILDSLMKIGTQKCLEFFVTAYETAVSQLTKEVALKCLWESNEAGKALFEALRLKADEEEQPLFNHVSHELINRHLLPTQF